MKKPLYKHLYAQVLFAIICGVILGHFWPQTGEAMKPFGDAFIKLIKMIIAPIIFCTVVTGIAGMEDMKKVGRVGGKALLYFEVVSTIAMIIGLIVVWFILRAGPIGAFGAMAFTIGKYGVASLIPLAKLMGSFYLTCLLFILVVLGLIARFVGFSILRFIVYIKEELLIVLGTSSSESVLPRMMAKMEKLGCSKSVVGLVIPAGYSFNLDGTSIYLTMAALFVAQATNTDLTLFQQLTILAVLLLTSKGASGVTGSGFIVLAATLSSVPTIPVAGLALILGIDRFMSEARALTNLIGNGVATVVVSKWEKELDHAQMERGLRRDVEGELEAEARLRHAAAKTAERPA